MKKYSGIPASPGIAVGKALVYREDELPEIPRHNIKTADVPLEWARLEKANIKAADEIKLLLASANKLNNKEQTGIFEAHLMMLEDPEYLFQLKNRLEKNLQNIEWIAYEQSREYAELLKSMPDPVFKERAVDVADVSRRVISILLGVQRSRFSLETLSEDVIIIAHDLMPSDAMMMNKPHVKGLVMDEGSRTCHTAILARSFHIPAVLGLSVISKEIKDGMLLAVDGSTGEVFADPDKKTLEQHKAKASLYNEKNAQLLALSDLPPETTDGYRVKLNANIEFPEEAKNALQYGAEGIGLYRSEFLFISSGLQVDEETQFNAYSQVIQTMGGKPVTIRTIDIGGDKELTDSKMPVEKNPLLGWRAIRLSLSKPEMFKVQLRAILRASVSGNVRIMFPMISCVEELEKALALLAEARDECKKKNQPFSENIETGVMIEVPSAAITSDIIAEKSDFFSIGTNDLIQYTIAVDRGNEKVNYLSDSHHPAILRLIKQTIDAAHKKGIKAAMCGELAGDIEATAILIGLRLDEFSMSASLIPQVKKIIRENSFDSCKALAEECLKARSGKVIRALVQKWNTIHK
jgi:phosphotransferase system enzyme I (PtsI)